MPRGINNRPSSNHGGPSRDRHGNPINLVSLASLGATSKDMEDLKLCIETLDTGQTYYGDLRKCQKETKKERKELVKKVVKPKAKTTAAPATVKPNPVKKEKAPEVKKEKKPKLYKKLNKKVEIAPTSQIQSVEINEHNRWVDVEAFMRELTPEEKKAGLLAFDVAMESHLNALLKDGSDTEKSMASSLLLLLSATRDNDRSQKVKALKQIDGLRKSKDRNVKSIAEKVYRQFVEKSVEISPRAQADTESLKMMELLLQTKKRDIDTENFLEKMVPDPLQVKEAKIPDEFVIVCLKVLPKIILLAQSGKSFEAIRKEVSLPADFDKYFELFKINAPSEINEHWLHTATLLKKNGNKAMAREVYRTFFEQEKTFKKNYETVKKESEVDLKAMAAEKIDKRAIVKSMKKSGYSSEEINFLADKFYDDSVDRYVDMAVTEKILNDKLPNLGMDWEEGQSKEAILRYKDSMGYGKVDFFHKSLNFSDETIDGIIDATVMIGTTIFIPGGIAIGGTKLVGKGIMMASKGGKVAKFAQKGTTFGKLSEKTGKIRHVGKLGKVYGTETALTVGGTAEMVTSGVAFDALQQYFVDGEWEPGKSTVLSVFMFGAMKGGSAMFRNIKSTPKYTDVSAGSGLKTAFKNRFKNGAKTTGYLLGETASQTGHMALASLAVEQFYDEREVLTVENLSKQAVTIFFLNMISRGIPFKNFRIKDNKDGTYNIKRDPKNYHEGHPSNLKQGERYNPETGAIMKPRLRYNRESGKWEPVGNTKPNMAKGSTQTYKPEMVKEKLKTSKAKKENNKTKDQQSYNPKKRKEEKHERKGSKEHQTYKPKRVLLRKNKEGAEKPKAKRKPLLRSFEKKRERATQVWKKDELVMAFRSDKLIKEGLNKEITALKKQAKKSSDKYLQEKANGQVKRLEDQIKKIDSGYRSMQRTLRRGDIQQYEVLKSEQVVNRLEGQLLVLQRNKAIQEGVVQKLEGQKIVVRKESRLKNQKKILKEKKGLIKSKKSEIEKAQLKVGGATVRSAQKGDVIVVDQKKYKITEPARDGVIKIKEEPYLLEINKLIKHKATVRRSYENILRNWKTVNKKEKKRMTEHLEALMTKKSQKYAQKNGIERKDGKNDVFDLNNVGVTEFQIVSVGTKSVQVAYKPKFDLAGKPVQMGEATKVKIPFGEIY